MGSNAGRMHTSCTPDVACHPMGLDHAYCAPDGCERCSNDGAEAAEVVIGATPAVEAVCENPALPPPPKLPFAVHPRDGQIRLLSGNGVRPGAPHKTPAEARIASKSGDDNDEGADVIEYHLKHHMKNHVKAFNYHRGQCHGRICMDFHEDGW